MTVIKVRELRFDSPFAIIFDTDTDRVPAGDCTPCTAPDSKQRENSHRLFVCLFVLARQPPVGHGLLILEVSRSHTTTHHSR